MPNLGGDLRTMPLPDILQWIESGRKTGTLRVRRRSIEKRIVFSEGRIHSSSSNDPRESLGQFLVRDGRVSEEQLFKGLLRQESEKRLLGSILVTDGVLSEDELKVTLQGLLASRLNPDQVRLVEKPDQAEVLLAGSYALFGKMFSIDVLLKNSLNGEET